MKKLLALALLILTSVAITSCGSSSCEDMPYAIKTTIPKRPAGQEDVIQLTAPAIPVVRVGFIGLGMRGPGAVSRMLNIPGVEVVALCDLEQDRVEAANDRVEAAGRPRAKEFYGSADAWRELTKLEDLDLVYIATDWSTHAMMGVQAMKDGKHVAIEVPAAMNLDEIWALINTSEQTRKHCMQLENCVYDFFELTTLNMVQQGLLGEVLHGEGAYIHNLEPFWNTYHNNWRLEYNIHNKGDVYPTHGIGPVCQAMNIHRGDKMNYLVSMQTKTVCIPEFILETTGRDVSAQMQNGDHTSTLIKTEKGKTILIEHNVATPRPYDRMYQLTGTKGFANKYPISGYALNGGEAFGDDIVTDHEDLSGHRFISKEAQTALMEKYKHPIHVELEETAKKIGGHGGMDFIMDYRLIYCLQNGLPLDMDVYDLAEWCSLTPLTKLSIENDSAPVQVPDFTRGGWDKLPKLEFAR
ncbi:MAG: Gfo/Idh/MocA family oxidoreductase [Rikenellaceae bacterium]